MNRLIEFFVKQKIFADLITIFMVILGVACLLLMKREAFPNIKFDVITVNTVFPGASPEEVERLITSPLEIELKEVEGIKNLYSVSRSGTSFIILQLDPDLVSEEEAKTDIQDVVDKFSDIPEAAERPVVTALSGGSYPVIGVSLSGPVEAMELRRLAREIETEFEKIPEVAKVVPEGMQDLEIFVEVDLKKMSSYRISLEDMVQALKNQNVSIPGGSLSNAEGEEILIRTSGDFSTIDDVENAVIRANDLGRALTVKDVAQVGFQLKDDDRLFRTNGKHSINLTVLRKSTADSIKLVNTVKELAQKLEKKYQGKLNFRLIDDESVWIKMRLNTVSSNLLVGLVLVLFVLSLLLPPMIATMVAMGIPFAFLGTMIYFYNANFSLNLLTMLGLVIVVGMLVDDAVVATENSMRLLEDGMSPEEAAIKGTQQVVPAILGSVLTTVLAFAPLMFMSGIFGKFVYYIPIGVIVALLVSLVEAFFILPNHFARWAKRPQDKKNKNILDRIYEKTSGFWDEKVVPAYGKWVAIFVRRRYPVLGGLILLIAFSGFLATRLRFVLFPADGIEIFMITADAKLGTRLDKTSELLKPLEKIILDLPKGEVQDFTTQIGRQMKDPGDPTTKYGSHLGLVVVYLTPEKDRSRKANEIIEDLRSKSASIEGIKINFEKINTGPPVGKAISIGIQGKEYSEILKLANLVKEDVSKIEGTSDLELSYQQGNKELQIDVNKAEAAAAGLSVAGIGQTVRAAFEGIVPTSIKKLDEEIDIRVSLPKEAANDAATAQKLLVPNAAGNLVPLSKVAQFRETQGIAAYIHTDNMREVKVVGQVDASKTDAGKVKAIIEAKIGAYAKEFPTLAVSFGGENKDTEESMNSLLRTFGVAFLGIFIVLVLTFQNLSQPLLVAFTIPIGAMSVIFAFFVHGAPLSFMGMLGIIALAGVIVNNAIVLVDFVNQLRKEGMKGEASVVRAAKLRLRPIFLTTVTTVFGILPTAYGIGGEDAFVKPIALALGWGLLFGSLITVFFFPGLISILDDFVAWAKRFRKQKIPTA